MLLDNPLVGFIAFLVAITVHEAAHALASDRLGDPTARIMGRLTLNPIPHIDLFGTILLPLMLTIAHSPIVFGWAKPVAFDPFNLRHPRRDAALISLAGPISNLLLAMLCSIFLHMFPATLHIPILSTFLLEVIILNVVLAVFNFVPIHPLDGFKIVGGILPKEYAKQWYDLEPYGMIFLIFLMFPILGGSAPLNHVITPIINFFLTIFLPGLGTPGII